MIHGKSYIKTLYDPSTSLGKIRNEALGEKIANAMPCLKDGCCALILERPGETGFFFHFLTQEQDHPMFCQKQFEISKTEIYVIAAILWGAKLTA